MRNKFTVKNFFVLGILLTLLWSLLTFIIIPNLNMLSITMFKNGKFDLTPLFKVIKSKRVLEALSNSFILGILVALSTNILGVFQLLVLDYFKIRGRKWLSIAYFAPLVCNGMVLVLSYYYLIGPNGYFTKGLQQIIPSLPNEWMIGFKAVFFQLTVSNTIFHITFVRDALRGIDFQTIEAAKNLGGSTWSILRKVVLPTLTPSILAATILNFLMAVGAFASPKILGGSMFQTINPLVLSFTKSRTTQNYGVILSVFLGLVTLLVLILFNYLQNRVNVVSVSKVKTKLVRQDIENRYVRIIMTLLAHLVAIIQIIPMLAVILFSFIPYKSLMSGNLFLQGLTLENWQNVMHSSGLKPLVVSFLYSVIAAIVSVIIVIFVARLITKYKNVFTKLLELIMLVPWFLPATLISLGLLLSFNTPIILIANQILTGTLVILLIGYIILRLPTNLRIIKAAYASIDSSLEDAAKNLGASEFKAFYKVILPLILPVSISTTLLSFTGLFAEFDMSVFLFHPLFAPLGIIINNATDPEATPSAVMLSFVYAVIIMLVFTIATYFVYGRKSPNNL
ncbi:iron ABC transporter permease [Ignavigranum ruoffiae]|uniref:ABC transporter permease n=1 Tax=Ignavigranum ruoffiae TaxID=89093 RepID=UPI0020618F37|nr:iron ABC transporter permease [Ignavigranum ruoffiae]UPQ86327.1 iron ABC transporter permease [Ignavigranum ruoffiae]